ncbi:hypothetical protein M758_UG025400 [Ceratodon purpureus]|nr:hypothetical protein M758_UG025400 [Ceratodon purpureus]
MYPATMAEGGMIPGGNKRDASAELMRHRCRTIPMTCLRGGLVIAHIGVVPAVRLIHRLLPTAITVVVYMDHRVDDVATIWKGADIASTRCQAGRSKVELVGNPMAPEDQAEDVVVQTLPLHHPLPDLVHPPG